MMAKGDDIQERLIAFAVAIIKLCSSLPKTSEGKHISRQLLRCGTSPAPNYGEARGAEAGKISSTSSVLFSRSLTNPVFGLKLSNVASNLLSNRFNDSQMSARSFARSSAQVLRRLADVKIRIEIV